MSKSVDFEGSMQRLEQIVMQLEKGELPLNEALAQFEAGIGLTRVCETVLQDAEKKMRELTMNSHSQSESTDE
ncbi:MAG: exodeoxyribonuclease VII small subunit [Legionella sp. 21-45-4]|nr:MAG: exodeoxyribonuclease VII small subunit [Legionella sp. 21-45-4]